MINNLVTIGIDNDNDVNTAHFLFLFTTAHSTPKVLSKTAADSNFDYCFCIIIINKIIHMTCQF